MYLATPYGCQATVRGLFIHVRDRGRAHCTRITPFWCAQIDASYLTIAPHGPRIAAGRCLDLTIDSLHALCDISKCMPEHAHATSVQQVCNKRLAHAWESNRKTSLHIQHSTRPTSGRGGVLSVRCRYAPRRGGWRRRWRRLGRRWRPQTSRWARRRRRRVERLVVGCWLAAEVLRRMPKR